MKVFETKSFLLLILFLLAILVLDYLTPLGYAVSVLYLVPLLFATRLPYRYAPLIVAGLATAIITAGAAFSPSGVLFEQAVVNRVLDITVLWVAVILLTKTDALERVSRISMSQRVLIAALVALLSLVGSVTLMFFWSSRLVTSNQEVVHTREALSTLHQIEAMLTGAQIGQRGYLFTHDPVQLHLYEHATATILDLLTRLRTLAGENPTQKRRLDELERLIDAQLAEVKEILLLSQEKTGQAARRLIESGIGTGAMEHVRRVLAEVEGEEQSLLNASLARADQSRSMTLAINTSSALLQVLLIIGVIFIFRKALVIHEEEIRTHLILSSIVESSDDAIMGLDLSGGVTSWNMGAERLYGYTAAEMINQPVWLLFPPDFRDEAVVLLSQIARGEQIAHHETVRQRKDGRFIDVSVTMSPIRNASGTIIGASNIVRDITERKQVEAALRANEERFRLVMKATNDVIWDWNLTTNEVQVNEALRYFGYSEHSFLESWWRERLHPADVGWVLWGLYHAIDDPTRHSWSADYRFRKADGHYADIFDRGLLVRDKEGRVIRMIGAMSDITERKRTGRLLYQSQAQLREAVEERERLAQDLHDNIIQTLYAISLGLDGCRGIIGKDPAAASKHLDQAVATLNGVIADVRNYIEWQNPVGAEVVDIGVELAQLAYNTRNETFNLRLHLDPKAIEQVMPDESRQVLLIAREAVSNSLRHSKATAGVLLLKATPDGLQMIIEDNGIGFTVADQAACGHGLLNMAARAKHLGAQLTILSGPGRGTTVRVDIPKGVALCR